MDLCGGFSLQSNMRLKKSGDYKRVYHYGKSAANRELVVYVLERSETPTLRFGISVSKKIGNAVVRNRVKRLIKEAIRLIMKQHKLKQHKDVVIIARMPAAKMDFSQIERSLKHIFKKTGLF